MAQHPPEQERIETFEACVRRVAPGFGDLILERFAALASEHQQRGEALVRLKNCAQLVVNMRANGPHAESEPELDPQRVLDVATKGLRDA